MGRRLRRNFEEISSPTGTRPCLTVLQWNVLADGLAQYGDFVRVRACLLSDACLIIGYSREWVRVCPCLPLMHA